MTAPEVFADPAFLRLSEQQQAFVRALIENGNDKVASARSAYTCKDDFTARTLANRALKKLTVARLVDAYFEEKPADRIPTRDELAAEAWRRAQSAADDNAAHKWVSLVARVLSYDKEPSAEPAQSAPKASADLGEDTLAELQKRGLGNGTAK